jgi:hypothetical protein
MYAMSAGMSMTPQMAIPQTGLQQEPVLKIFPQIGSAPNAVLEKTAFPKNKKPDFSKEESLDVFIQAFFFESERSSSYESSRIDEPFV